MTDAQTFSASAGLIQGSQNLVDDPGLPELFIMAKIRELNLEFNRFHNFDDRVEFNRFLQNAFLIISNLVKADLTYYRHINVGQDNEYLENVATAAYRTSDIQWDEILYQVKMVELASTSIVGHTACSPEKRTKLLVGPERTSEFVEIWQIDDVDSLPPILLGPTKQVQSRGYNTGSMFVVAISFPGEPIRRFFQFVREKDNVGNLEIFQKQERLLIESCALILSLLLKNLEEASGISNTDMLKEHSAMQARKIILLTEELRSKKELLKHQIGLTQQQGEIARGLLQ